MKPTHINLGPLASLNSVLVQRVIIEYVLYEHKMGRQYLRFSFFKRGEFGYLSLGSKRQFSADFGFLIPESRFGIPTDESPTDNSSSEQEALPLHLLCKKLSSSLEKHSKFIDGNDENYSDWLNTLNNFMQKNPCYFIAFDEREVIEHWSEVRILPFNAVTPDKICSQIMLPLPPGGDAPYGPLGSEDPMVRRAQSLPSDYVNHVWNIKGEQEVSDSVDKLYEILGNGGDGADLRKK